VLVYRALLVLTLVGCQAAPVQSVVDKSKIVSRRPAIAGPTVKPVEMNKYPAVGRIKRSGEQSCTGTLIAKNVFLTASHCIDPSNTSDLLIDFPNSTSEKRKFGISEVKVPDRFSFNTAGDAGDDIALLILSSAPAIVPMDRFDESFQEESFPSKAIAVGYGKTAEGAPSEVLLGGDMKFAGARDHLNQGVSRGLDLIFEPAPDYVRGGDSGGPILVRSGKRDVVVGVLSGPGGNTKNNYSFAGREAKWLSEALEEISSGQKKIIRSAFLGVSSDRFIQAEYYDSTLLALLSFWKVEFNGNGFQCRLKGHRSEGSFYSEAKIEKDTIFMNQTVPCTRDKDSALRIELDELKSILQSTSAYTGTIIKVSDQTVVEENRENLLHLVFSLEVEGPGAEPSLIRQVHCAFEKNEDESFGKVNIYYGHNCYHIKP
jgi:hypothetical protein